MRYRSMHMDCEWAGGTTGSSEHFWFARPDLHLFEVSSPTGASPVAASFALRAAASALEAGSPPRSTLERAECAELRAAITAAEAGWREQVRNDPTLGAVDATLAALWLRRDRAAVAHLGDCRVYRLRGGQVSRTNDHTAPRSPHGRLLLRTFCLGGNPEVMAWDIAEGDVFFLSAGVHDVLSDDELSAHLASTAGPNEIISALLARVALTPVKRPPTALIVKL